MEPEYVHDDKFIRLEQSVEGFCDWVSVDACTCPYHALVVEGVRLVPLAAVWLRSLHMLVSQGCSARGYALSCQGGDRFPQVGILRRSVTVSFTTPSQQHPYGSGLCDDCDDGDDGPAALHFLALPPTSPFSFLHSSLR